MGNLYYFFPTGKFNYTWVESPDFNMTSGDWKPSVWTSALEAFKNDEQNIKGVYLHMIHPYLKTNKQFNVAYNAMFEIWFDTKMYFLVPPGDELGELFEK